MWASCESPWQLSTVSLKAIHELCAGADVPGTFTCHVTDVESCRRKSSDYVIAHGLRHHGAYQTAESASLCTLEQSKQQTELQKMSDFILASEI